MQKNENEEPLEALKAIIDIYLFEERKTIEEHARRMEIILDEQNYIDELWGPVRPETSGAVRIP